MGWLHAGCIASISRAWIVVRAVGVPTGIDDRRRVCVGDLLYQVVDGALCHQVACIALEPRFNDFGTNEDNQLALRQRRIVIAEHTTKMFPVHDPGNAHVRFDLVAPHESADDGGFAVLQLEPGCCRPRVDNRLAAIEPAEPEANAQGGVLSEPNVNS